MVESIIIVIMLLGIVFQEGRAMAMAKRKEEKQIEMKNLEKVDLSK